VDSQSRPVRRVPGAGPRLAMAAGTATSAKGPANPRTSTASSRAYPLSRGSRGRGDRLAIMLAPVGRIRPAGRRVRTGPGARRPRPLPCRCNSSSRTPFLCKRRTPDVACRGRPRRAPGHLPPGDAHRLFPPAARYPKPAAFRSSRKRRCSRRKRARRGCEVVAGAARKGEDARSDIVSRKVSGRCSSSALHMRAALRGPRLCDVRREQSLTTRAEEAVFSREQDRFAAAARQGFSALERSCSSASRRTVKMPRHGHRHASGFVVDEWLRSKRLTEHDGCAAPPAVHDPTARCRQPPRRHGRACGGVCRATTRSADASKTWTCGR
jgi:hypothetical protein